MSDPLAVYVHIPFCTVKCGYCDFNAYAGLDSLKPAYGRALVREVELDAGLLSQRVVSSVGFGGGTPGESPAADIASVLEAVRRVGRVAPDAEISLEANPGSTGATALRELRAAGVNRISFGAQSFHTDELRFLDRIHSPEATGAAVQLARDAGFESVGLDLMYGLEGQTDARWQGSLDAAIALRPDHVSCYALTVEERTPLARLVERGEVKLPDEDAAADLYELAGGTLKEAGFEQYELSNWAKPGHESRHNLAYWINRDYLAIGAGAHGYVCGERQENIAHPGRYIAAVEEGTGEFPAVMSRYRPGRATAMGDWLATRLRLVAGFAREEFEAKFDVPLEVVAGPVLADCTAAGLLEAGGCVRVTPRGRLLHGEICARLVAHLSDGQR